MEYTEYDRQILPPVLFSILFIAFTLAFLLRRRSERVRSISSAIVAALLLFIEIIKQRWNILGEFDHFYLPLHYCSWFAIVIPLAELCGRRLSRIFRPIAASMAFIVAVGMYIFPGAILGSACELFGQEFYPTHSFIFHHLVVVYSVLSITLNFKIPELADAVRVGLLGLVYTAIALPLSYAFDTNYCNFLTSVLPSFEAFRVAEGQALYIVILSSFIIFGTFIGSLVYIGVRRGIASLFCFVKSKMTRKKAAT